MMENQQIKVRLFHSVIGTPPDQRATVRGLGLGHLYQERVLRDTPAIRGMIRKVAHLVSVSTPSPLVGEGGGEGEKSRSREGKKKVESKKTVKPTKKTKKEA